MSKDIKKALEHCVEWKCDNCPNGDDLGSGETVCRGRLLPKVLKYVADLEVKLAESEERLELADCIINQYADKDKNYAQQLTEKEKEIRKQVCETIFEEVQENIDCYFEIRQCNSPHTQHDYIWFNEIRFRKFLDQIEQEKESLE